MPTLANLNPLLSYRNNIGENRHGDPAVLIGTLEEALSLFGWKPERSDLEVQVRDAWKWVTRQS